MVMKKFSTILFLIGLLLIAGAALFCYSNLKEEREAGRLANDVGFRITASIQEEQSFSEEYDVVPDYLLNPDMEMPTTEVDNFSYIGSLVIPTLGLNLPIMDQWSYPGLKIAPGRYLGSAYDDTFVICGHNYKNHFGSLYTLASGDEVVFTDLDGNKFAYQVDNVETIDPYDRENVINDNWDLTMFTCTPGGKTRVVVHCLAAVIE